MDPVDARVTISTGRWSRSLWPTTLPACIEARLPVFTGDVDDRSPDYLDRHACDFLSAREREAVNRLHLGSAIINGNPARTLPADGVVARALFASVAEEFERHKEDE